MTKILGWAALAAGGYLFYYFLPEMRRYIRVRSM